MGGYITGVIGLLIFPWKLISDPSGYIFKWLIAYSSLLGPIGGILIADYYLVRKKKVNLEALYRRDSEYWYQNGYNGAAISALILGIIPNVPGFMTTMGFVPADSFPSALSGLYHYAWFVGLIIGGGTYVLFMKIKREKST